MARPTPMNEEAALRQLREEYERVTGKPVDDMADLICTMSAERAMTDNWEWQKNDNPNWPVQLNWIS